MNPDNNTQVKFGDKATEALMKGVNLVCDATATTLGPLGKNVAIDKGYTHIVLHDGVSVSESINPKDPYEKLGAKIIKEAAKKQRDQVGDGTTAVMVLAKAILKEALKATSSGVNPMSLRKGLEEGSDIIIKELKKQSKPIKTLEQKIQIATISAEDPELGKMIAETRNKIGDDGIMVVEESKMPDTLIEMQDGMQFERGWAHSFMITDPERMTTVLEDVHVLISDIPLNNLIDIGKFLEEKVLKQGIVKMVFIVPEVGGDFLQALLGAKINGKFLGLVVKNPMVGNQAIEFLQDLCALTGAKLVSKEAGHKFEDIDLSWCGRIGRIVSTKVSTTITKSAGLKADILQRIATIKKQMEEKDLSDFDKEKLKERLAKLTSGVAVVKVGGETEVEMKERKERAIDAIASTTAAIKYGIVAGGEIPYLSAREALESTTLGQKILYDALSEPFKKLVANAGYDSGEMLSDWKHKGDRMIGFDVVKGEWVSMIEAGVLDPTSVLTTAVKTAVSCAVAIMSIGACVVPEDKDEKKN
jgi:chaperonin GroEL